MNAQTFIFFGMHGSGKGTQIELLTEILETRSGQEVLSISTGDEFRKLISSGSYTGNLIKNSMARGELQLDQPTNAIVHSILITSLTEKSHLIFDGYPRTLDQAVYFEQMMRFFQRTNIKIIFIALSAEEGLKRNLLRGRSDDTEASITKRLDEYTKKVIPTMDYFKDKTEYQLIEINGEQSVEEVHKDIIKALNL